MKLNKEQFKQFILSEVKKIVTSENWIESEDSETSKKSLHGCGCGCTDFESEEGNSVTEIPSENDFEDVIPEVEEKKTEVVIKESKLKDAQKLAEEIKRMKQLLDFRAPLLGENPTT